VVLAGAGILEHDVVLVRCACTRAFDTQEFVLRGVSG